MYSKCWTGEHPRNEDWRKRSLCRTLVAGSVTASGVDGGQVKKSQCNGRTNRLKNVAPKRVISESVGRVGQGRLEWALRNFLDCGYGESSTAE